MLLKCLYVGIVITFGGLGWLQLKARMAGRYWSGYFSYIGENWAQTKKPIFVAGIGILIIAICVSLNALGIGTLAVH